MVACQAVSAPISIHILTGKATRIELIDIQVSASSGICHFMTNRRWVVADFVARCVCRQAHETGKYKRRS